MKSRKKILSLLLVVVMIFTLSLSSLADAGAKDIVILHTNDVHGGYEGYASLAAYRAEMAETSYVSLVDAGDFSQGSTMATLSNGEYLIELMNKVGYDVVVPGNHEFDYGMAQALKNLRALDATVVSCNFVDLASGDPVFEAYTVVDYGGTKVAYVGVSTPETYTKSTPTYFMNEQGQYIYSFCEGADFYNTIQAAVTAAAAEADYVVAIGHCGIDEQSSPWTSREIIANTTGIDAFIDGHSHSTIENELVRNRDGQNVVLAQTGTKLGAIGKLTIKADGSLTSELVTDYTGEDAAVAAAVAETVAMYDNLIQEVVATSEVDLVAKKADGSWAVRNAETNMGDLIADAYRIIMEADIGIMNGGGIRDNIAAGEVTYKNILDVMTFGNKATVVVATGQQILDCLEMGASAFPGMSGGFVHVSGMSYTIDTTVDSSVVKDEKGNFSSVSGEYRVKNVMVGGEALDLAKTYTVACHSYWLTSYGDGMTMFRGCELVAEKHEAYVDNEMLVLFIRDNLKGNIGREYAEPQGRITIETAFSDVGVNDWYYDSVMSVYKSGMMNGMGGDRFEPNTDLTRAMLVTMLYRMENSPTVNGSVSELFSDCEDGQWYSNAVLWAQQNEIVNGMGDGTFAPIARLTRQQMATIIYNYAVYKGAPALTEADLSQFADAGAIAGWAALGVTYCAAEEIMGSTSTTALIFAPATGASRAMGAAVLTRIAA